ncbi:hypothetical protein B0T26DRAFT_747199 [Lasiosphaeria miniovina]|uniref:Uncharacterized protein n=1 Tax=Lasiosphaeria miniovina TaxID=1954250 RepID=A0AA40E6G1_9PEZI|nr:uncharacterized protein B0T26DRAFT_747199 [Lasiosphaeria miniovina]KAK0726802.1 hypothetical protein B0T26DRAFT_747199 [Lasiosphaeria miniovina]
MEKIEDYSTATFRDLYLAAPEFLQTEDAVRQGTRGYLDGRNQDFRRWLEAAYLSPRQREALANPNQYRGIKVGIPFFADVESDNSWWNMPRNRLPGRYLNALVVAVTGAFRDIGYCSSCRMDSPEELFFGKCIAALGDDFVGCANCILNNTADECDVYKPFMVCLMPACDESGPGHEHVLRDWLDRRYRNSEDGAVSALFRCEWAYAIFTTPEFYKEVLAKIMVGREVDSHVADALLAASREITVRKACQTCANSERKPITWCTRTPVPSFHGGACPTCILNGCECIRPDGWADEEDGDNDDDDNGNDNQEEEDNESDGDVYQEDDGEEPYTDDDEWEGFVSDN